jgi:hypothetical protein
VQGGVSAKVHAFRTLFTTRPKTQAKEAKASIPPNQGILVLNQPRLARSGEQQIHLTLLIAQMCR